MEEKSSLICDACQARLEEAQVQFRYLGKSFRYKAPRCPVCGQVYLSAELVTGRMEDVERQLEDK